MYRTSKSYQLFLGGHSTLFFKDGELIGRRNPDGSYQLFHYPSEPITLTRAQGCRYWRKHFNDCGIFELPPAIVEAVEQCPDVW